MFLNEIIATLKKGGVVVLPTDTIYGLHCIAKEHEAVNKIYEIKKRGKDMPFILLIGNIKDLDEFGVEITEDITKQINNLWPGPNTLILETHSDKYQHINAGKNTIGFRLPDNDLLINIINEVGPLVSTSANITSMQTPNNVEDIINIFKDKVDLYIDGGILNNNPSRIFRIEDDSLLKLR